MSCEIVNVEDCGARDSVLKRIAHWLRVKQQRRDERAEFSKIMKLEDHLLTDIGVNRDAVDWAQRLPASRDPGMELAKSVGRIGVITPK